MLLISIDSCDLYRKESHVLTKMPMEPLGESRPPTMLKPRLFLRDPLEKVTSQMAVDKERDRRKWPSTRSTLVDGANEASLSRLLTVKGFLLVGGEAEPID